MTTPRIDEQLHEQNLRDLRMIRDDLGWALAAVQNWRRLERERPLLLDVVEAARELHAEVEMGESVGVCLIRRGPSLLLGEALAALDGVASTGVRDDPGEKST
jgi:hypothetical protein